MTDGTDRQSDAVTKCVQYVAMTVEECCNGKVIKSADTESVKSLNGEAETASKHNEILFGINATPPWYLVIAYALQVRLLPSSQCLMLVFSSCHLCVLPVVRLSVPMTSWQGGRGAGGQCKEGLCKPNPGFSEPS